MRKILVPLKYISLCTKLANCLARFLENHCFCHTKSDMFLIDIDIFTKIFVTLKSLMKGD